MTPTGFCVCFYAIHVTIAAVVVANATINDITLNIITRKNFSMYLLLELHTHLGL